MKTGETIQDAQGGGWQLGQLLGRGLWGKAYAVRRESDDAAFVLKCPLGPEDFRSEIPASDQVFAACREAALEQARLCAEGRHAFLPRLEARVTLPNGAPGYVITRLPDSLERRMAEGLHTSALLETASAVLRLARQLPNGWHGCLRPANILFNERGEVFLSDVATPAVQRSLRTLVAASPGLAHAWPPEIAEGPEGMTSAGVDAWGVAMTLWQGAMAGAPAPNPPRHGLDKAAQMALRDRLQDRLKTEDANPRFHARVAERYAVLLARALSREPAPSPPFRFPNLDELITRVEEVASLIRPQVSSVGKVLLDRGATKPWYDTDEAVAFSCTVACTSGVEGPEEIGVGIAVFDIDKDQRLKDLDLAYTVDKHPGSGPGGGRYRFGFKVTGLGPGRFRARLAFAIRDSGQSPATTESEFNIVPAPGWVPKAEAPSAAAIPFPREIEEPTRPGKDRPDLVDVPRSPAAASGGTGGGTNGGTNGPTRVSPSANPAPTSSGNTLSGVRRLPMPTGPGPRVVATDQPAAHERAGVIERPAPAPVERVGPRPGPIASTSGASTSGASTSGATAGPRPLPRAPEAAPSSPRSTSLIASPSSPNAPVSAPVPAPLSALGAAPASVLGAAPVSAAPPSTLRVVAPTTVVEEDPEPTWQPRSSWTDEPLPGGTSNAPESPGEEPDLEPDDEGPGLLARVTDQLRNDPYLAVMAALGAAVVGLLILFLLLRE